MTPAVLSPSATMAVDQPIKNRRGGGGSSGGLRRRLFLTRNGLVRPMCHTLSLGAVLAQSLTSYLASLQNKQVPRIQFLVG